MNLLFITPELSTFPNTGEPGSYLSFIEILHTNTVNNCAKVPGSVSLCEETKEIKGR